MGRFLARTLLAFGLVAATVATAEAGMRTATMAVSVTVVASCRVSIAPVASHHGSLQHRGHCSQAVRPLTRAVIDQPPTNGPAVVVRAYENSAMKWIRYDVEY